MSGLMSGEWKRSARQAIQAPATERAGHPLRSGLNTTAPLLDSTMASTQGLRARRGGWRGATTEHIRQQSATEKQQSQPPRPAARPAPSTRDAFIISHHDHNQLSG
jgi:hypothetical protein